MCIYLSSAGLGSAGLDVKNSGKKVRSWLLFSKTNKMMKARRH